MPPWQHVLSRWLLHLVTSSVFLVPRVCCAKVASDGMAHAHAVQAARCLPVSAVYCIARGDTSLLLVQDAFQWHALLGTDAPTKPLLLAKKGQVAPCICPGIVPGSD